MKKIYLVVTFVTLYVLLVTPAHAGTFFDNFNDGNTDGWISAKPCTYCGLGNWRVDNGILIEDNGRDHYKFLVSNYSLSDQSVETKVLFHAYGYAGITVWYQDENNWVDVLIFPGHSPVSLRVLEYIDGAGPLYFYYSLVSTDQTWHTMRVDADSLTGKLIIYLDGAYTATHTVTTTKRIGLSGLNSGNAGGSFNDFTLTSDSIVDPLTDKTQCKKGGWKVFTNPTFKNQGACVSYIESNQKAGKRN